jgi:hypothetical protein
MTVIRQLHEAGYLQGPEQLLSVVTRYKIEISGNHAEHLLKYHAAALTG